MSVSEAIEIPLIEATNESLKEYGYLIDNYQKSEIEIGVRSQGNLEVLNGLKEGDKIIAEGLTKVRPGMKVKPINKQ